VALIPPAVWRIGAAGDHSFVTVGGVDVSADLQELVERRGALRARMLELRSDSPEDHDGFLRTVDQLLAVSNRIVEIFSAPPDAATDLTATDPTATDPTATEETPTDETPTHPSQ
jgi:hypothetical protein